MIRSLTGRLFPAEAVEGSPPRIASAFVLTVAGVFVQGLSRLGYSILVGRLLGAEALGDVGSVIALASVLVLLWPAASGNAVSKFVALASGENDPATARASARFSGVHAVVAGVLLGAVAALVVTWYFRLPWHAAASAALLVLSMSGYNYARGLRVGRRHFESAALWDAVTSLLTLTLLTGVLLARWSSVLLLPLVAGYLLYAVSAWPGGRGGRLPAARRREIVRFTAWSSLNILAAGGLLQLSIVVARQWSTPAELGWYAAAVQLATPASMLSGALMTAIAPTIVRHYAVGDMEGLRRQLDAIMRMAVAFFLPLFAVAILWSPVIIVVVYGTAFRDGAPLLAILLLAVSASSFIAANARLNGTDERGIRDLALVNIGSLVGGLALMVPLGSAIGVTGAAVGYGAGALASALVPFALVWRRDSMPWGGVALRVLAGYALLVVLLVGVLRGSYGVPSMAAVSAAFVAVWALLNRQQYAQAYRTVRARTAR